MKSSFNKIYESILNESIEDTLMRAKAKEHTLKQIEKMIELDKQQQQYDIKFTSNSPGMTKRKLDFLRLNGWAVVLKTKDPSGNYYTAYLNTEGLKELKRIKEENRKK